MSKIFNRDVRINWWALYVWEVEVISKAWVVTVTAVSPTLTSDLTTTWNTILWNASSDTLDLQALTTVKTDQKIQFRDTGIYLNSSVNWTLNIAADTILEIVAPTITVTWATWIVWAATVTSASAASLAVGRLWATTPAFTVDSSTGSQVAWLKVTGAATGWTVAVVATDSWADASVTVNAKWAGTIWIGTVSTWIVTITPATTVTGLLTLTAWTTWKVIHAWTETIAAWWTTTALDLTKFHHDIDADAWGDIFTLANGTAWQLTLIVLKTATWIATITPATFLWWTSVTLNAVWESILFYYGALWWQIAWWYWFTVI